MKKMKFYLLAFSMVFANFAFAGNGESKSDNDPVTISNETEIDAATQARINELTNRLDELKAIDKSELERSEKKELRKEVVEIKKELKEQRGAGIYISGGALLVIIILLIIL